jgi:alkylation response protein AidB-like acyl-CoA dehydrogenase
MTESAPDQDAAATLPTLPGDDVRQLMWRFAERYDLQMVVQNARAVARGPVARLVAAGARGSHEWTDDKASLLPAFDEAGLTSLALGPEQGGFIEGPKNLALALAAFEVAWVDAGAATCSLAGHLALAPIEERGTDEQRAAYLGRAAPPPPGEGRAVSRGAFCLTEPLPYVGVDTGVLSGKARIASWNEGEEPVLQIDKRGRFITNMGFADFVTAAVDSADERIRGSFMVILEKDDPGTFDRGTPTRKLVHQLSSTRDPIFSLRCPASRIIGGYTVVDGAIVPNHAHAEVIAAVFRRTRITVGLMTAAKLLSAIEPVIRYQRGRFRGGDLAQPGTPRYDLGLQLKEDVRQRLIDVWATGEAAASLGFAAARLFDELEPLERHKAEVFAARGIKAGRAELRALRAVEPKAEELLALGALPPAERDAARHDELAADPLVRFALADALANVLCPACKLWSTGHGATVMREAVSLMGGYGITEDCPGFLGQKWMDAQLEATYEGPESVQRRQLSLTMTQRLFLAQLVRHATELRRLATDEREIGAGPLAAAIEVWTWTLSHLQRSTDAAGRKLYGDQRQGITFAMADALCWLLGARQLICDVRALATEGASHPTVAEALPGYLSFYRDLCQVQAARAAGEVGRICAELVHGHRRPLDPTGAGALQGAPDDSSTRAELAAFARLRASLDGSLAGSRLAKDRAALALTQVMIPEALDYPS